MGILERFAIIKRNRKWVLSFVYSPLSLKFFCRVSRRFQSPPTARDDSFVRFLTESKKKNKKEKTRNKEEKSVTRIVVYLVHTSRVAACIEQTRPSYSHVCSYFKVNTFFFRFPFSLNAHLVSYSPTVVAFHWRSLGLVYWEMNYVVLPDNFNVSRSRLDENKPKLACGGDKFPVK